MKERERERGRGRLPRPSSYPLLPPPPSIHPPTPSRPPKFSGKQPGGGGRAGRPAWRRAGRLSCRFKAHNESAFLPSARARRRRRRWWRRRGWPTSPLRGLSVAVAFGSCRGERESRKRTPRTDDGGAGGGDLWAASPFVGMRGESERRRPSGIGRRRQRRRPNSLTKYGL